MLATLQILVPDMGILVNFISIAAVSIAFLDQPVVTQGANTTFPLYNAAHILQGDGSQTCPSEEQGIARNVVKIHVRKLLRKSVVPLVKTFACGGSTGWRRVAYLNMTDPSQNCPFVWQEITTTHRVCGRRSGQPSCEGLNYSTGNKQYQHVCGRIIGYQIGNPDAFENHPINSSYVDGISVTHGSPRQHVWTFAAGIDDEGIFNHYAVCPCVSGSASGSRIASFVGQNYFCESGLTWWNTSRGHDHFWSDGDPLWDGKGCGPRSACCTFNTPPWFNVALPLPTTDDIEVRICGNEGTWNEDTPIQFMELYVK